jgi:hypothetical protein
MMKPRTRKTLASFALVLLARTAGAESGGAPPWQEGFTARLEALALLQTLNAELLSHDSATLTLDRWCAAHRLASPAVPVFCCSRRGGTISARRLSEP